MTPESVTKFLQLGLRDLDRRLGAIVRPEKRKSDERVVGLLESSFAIGLAARVVSVVALAVKESAVMATVNRARAVWRQLPWGQRRSLGAVTLLSAVAVHLLLTSVQGWPPGWLWLVPPGIALAVAGLLAMTSGRGGHAA